MKKTGLIEILNNGNIKRIFALVMALLLFTLTACSSQGTQTNSSNPSNSSSQNDVSSGDASSGDASTNDSSSEETDTSSDSSTASGSSEGFVLGNLSVDGQTVSNTIASDANEIEQIVDPSNLITNYKGYAEKERNQRLNEILNTPNTLELYKVKGNVYYVSTSGNDSNDGLTPETAIRSLEAVDGLPLKDGDAVLFERGCIWRMSETFYCRSNVTYGSYGEGRKPMFLGSPKNYAQEIWKPSNKKNVWQINYMYSYPCGAFFDQGKEAGYLKTTMRGMTANTHFYYDESMATLYLYCDKGNPSDVWDSIEFSQAGVRVQVNAHAKNVVIDNIAIRYTGQGGIQGNYNVTGFTVTNCEVGFVGGAWVGGDPSSGKRYCNGLESWCSGSNLKWDHNWVYQTFDSAMSPQGNQVQDFHNMSMSNNLLEFNNCDIESWTRSTDDFGTYSNYVMDNNICRFTSLGWGTRKDDGGIRGIDGVQYGGLRPDQIVGKFSFSNNIIDCPGRQIYKVETHNKGVYDNFIRENNTYYIKQSMRTTEQLTTNFHWIDAETRLVRHTAKDKKGTIDAFKEFEPTAKVYWYK